MQVQARGRRWCQRPSGVSGDVRVVLRRRLRGTAKPTPGPVAACEDSTSWYYAGKERKNCEYVAKATADRCEKEDESGTSATEACPATCDTCPEQPN